MIGGFWNIVRASFKKRFALYYIVVSSLLLFGTFPSLIVRLAAFVVFFAASIFFVPIFTSQFIFQLRQILAHRKRERLPVSSEIVDLSKRIGCRVKELGIVDGCTAYVLGSSLVLGTKLLEELTFDERQAVIAHELGHIKRKHAVIRMALMIPLLAALFYSWSKLSSPIFLSESFTQVVLTVMLYVGMLAFVMLGTIPANWQVEFDADKIAARFVGKEHIKSALLKLGKGKNLKEPSETHPSIAERVKAIDKLRT